MINIKFGDNNDEVKNLQNQLIKLLFPIKADGDFGNKTLSAVTQFQTWNKIPANGIVDDVTYNILISEIQYNIDQISYTRIAGLHPKIKAEVLHLTKMCYKNNVRIRIVQGYRTFAEQDALYAQGRTKPGPIITKARAGYSNHNYGLACYDDKTEVLTNNGFKLFKDLLPDDLVATFKDDVCQFEYPFAHISYDYKGDMVRIKTRSVDQLVTPNHKMIVKKKINGKWEEKWNFITADKINHQYKIPTNGINWLYNNDDNEEVFEISNKSVHSKYSIVNNNVVNNFVINYPFKNYMNAEHWWTFMGWYLSEGWCAGTKNNIIPNHNNRFKVGICQSKKSDVRYKLKQCLDNTKFIYGENSSGFYIHSKELHSVLFTLGTSYKKYIPSYLLEAPLHLLNKLYYSLIDGDGCYYKDHEAYYTCSKKMCDSFVELCLRIGFSATINIRKKEIGTQILPQGTYNQTAILNYEIVVRRGITQELRSGNGKARIFKEFYEGKVYCVSTISGAIFTKRNNKISVGGNCDFCLLHANGSISWSELEDADNDGQKDWMEVINIFKKSGFSAGIDWNFRDSPHIEKTFGNSIRTLLRLYNEGKKDTNGFVII